MRPHGLARRNAAGGRVYGISAVRLKFTFPFKFGVRGGSVPGRRQRPFRNAPHGSCYHWRMPPPPIIDAPAKARHTYSMFRAITMSFVRGPVEELLSRPLQDIRDSIIRLENKIDHQAAKMSDRIDDVLEQIGGVRAEMGKMRGEFGGEIGKLRGEMGEFRGEMRGEIGSLKTEVAAVKSDVTLLRSDTAQRINRLEDRGW